MTTSDSRKDTRFVFNTTSPRKIGVLDADLIEKTSYFPNLALMKISTYLKSLGHDVVLLMTYPEIETCYRVYVSKVFLKTETNPALFLDNVIIGGTGFPEHDIPLPEYINTLSPDYTLYDDVISRGFIPSNRIRYYKEYAILFMTRGCFRKCSFCVNKKYDAAFRSDNLKDSLLSHHTKIICLDDNVLSYDIGSDSWRDVFRELNSTGIPFQFNQGLDIRLLDEEKSRVINESRLTGDVIFAYDDINQEKLIESKLELWRSISNRSTKLYLLCAYKSTGPQDIVDLFERIKLISKYDCIPYMMRHENYKMSRYKGLYITLARWCNQPRFFKKMSFREFVELDQSLKKKQDKMYSAMRSLVEFERDFPEISEKYFNFKFNDESNKRLKHD